MDRLAQELEKVVGEVKEGKVSASTAVLLAGVAVCFIPVLNALRGTKRKYPLPPGPRGIPIFGNAFQIPTSRPWFYFAELGKKYGSLVYLNISGKHTIVLTDLEAAKELLELRGATTSSRPTQIVAEKYMSGSKRILFLPYGDLWRKQRQAIHKYLMLKSVLSYAPLQMLEVKKSIVDLIDKPEDFDHHLRRYTASIALKFTYGVRCATGNEAKLREMDRIAMAFLHALGFGPFLVDVIPALEYLPDFLAPWRVRAKGLFRDAIKLYGGLANDVKKQMENGTADPDCLMKELWDKQRANGMDDEDIAMLGGGAFEAGTDTTANTLRCFIMAAVCNPQVTKKAQKEIEEVLSGEPPTIDDIEKLPYVRAIVKECLRYRTVAPNGTNHETTADEVVMGYLIPKGSTLIINIWGMNMNERDWAEPTKFMPERYSVADCADMTTQHAGFGRGRRICPGLHLATRSLVLVISRLLWTFDFDYATDPVTGKQIPIDVDDTDLSGVVNPFKCKIMPRSAGRAQRARQEWEDVAGEAGPSLE